MRSRARRTCTSRSVGTGVGGAEFTTPRAYRASGRAHVRADRIGIENIRPSAANRRLEACPPRPNTNTEGDHRLATSYCVQRLATRSTFALVRPFWTCLKHTKTVQEHWMRALIRLFGFGTLLFGIGPTLAPRWFGRLFDLPVSSDERLLVMVRSVGVRDATIGLALILTAPRPDAYRAWLSARIAADAGDMLAVGLAVLRGERQPRFVALGALALSASMTGLALRWLTRADQPPVRG